MKVTYIAKTNLNNDGRILNQIKILQNFYKSNLHIDFILLADVPLSIQLGKGVYVHEIKTYIRNSSLLRFFIVLEFTWRAFRKLWKLRPKVIHVQDLAVVLPVYMYRIVKGRSFKLIYDDHEMPNENESFQYRLLQFFEVRLMRLADHVIFANKERKEIIEDDLRLYKSSYFLNLPYFDQSESSRGFLMNEDINQKYTSLVQLKEEGFKLIIHQGALEIERGREKLAKFSRLNLPYTKICIVGISQSEFNLFIDEYSLDRNAFCFVGSVPYNILNEFWKLADAAIIMYLPTYINNRLCAPNRYFLALKHKIPTIVNVDNPVLYNFSNRYKSGFFIEEILDGNQLVAIYEHKYNEDTLDNMILEEIKRFTNLYESII